MDYWLKLGNKIARDQVDANNAIGGSFMKKEYFEIILEDVKGKFDLLAEGQSSLQREIGNVRMELKGDIDQVRSQLEFVYKKLDSKIDLVEKNLTKRIDVGMEKIESHEIRILQLERN